MQDFSVTLICHSHWSSWIISHISQMSEATHRSDLNLLAHLVNNMNPVSLIQSSVLSITHYSITLHTVKERVNIWCIIFLYSLKNNGCKLSVNRLSCCQWAQCSDSNASTCRGLCVLSCVVWKWFKIKTN